MLRSMTTRPLALAFGLALGLAFLLSLATPAAAQDDPLDCADFASQAEAQAALRADPTDPTANDADNDGIACELVGYDDPATDLTPVAAAIAAPAVGSDAAPSALPSAAPSAPATTAVTTMPASGTGSTIDLGLAADLPVGAALGLASLAVTCGGLALRRFRHAA